MENNFDSWTVDVNNHMRRATSDVNYMKEVTDHLSRKVEYLETVLNGYARDHQFLLNKIDSFNVLMKQMAKDKNDLELRVKQLEEVRDGDDG